MVDNSVKKYKDLSVNTLLFMISSLGSKLVSFLLVPLYTNVLSTRDYGKIDLISATTQLLIPLLTLNIQDAVLRFSIDKGCSAEKVIGVGIKVILLSSSILGLVLYFIGQYKIIDLENHYLVFLFLSFCLGIVYNCFSMYLRARNRVKVLAMYGLVNTILTCILNILFLLGLGMGVIGYLLANILGTLISVLGMFFTGEIYKEADIRGRSSMLLKKMTHYSFPLVLNSLAWWLNNTSDRYVLTFFCGSTINGIYAVSYKIPTILSVIQNVFYNAWSISAITEFDRDDKDGFIGEVYSLYSCISIVTCSIILFANIFLAQILYAKDFFQAWKYVPPLVVGTVFNGIALFEGCLFTAVKQTKEVSNTTLTGALINTVLNFVLIPYTGAFGAAIATMLGYLIIWIARTLKVLKIVNMRVKWKKHIFCTIVMLLQVAIASNEKIYFLQIFCVFLIILFQREYFFKIVNFVIISIQNILNKKRH